MDNSDDWLEVSCILEKRAVVMTKGVVSFGLEELIIVASGCEVTPVVDICIGVEEKAALLFSSELTVSAEVDVVVCVDMSADVV